MTGPNLWICLHRGCQHIGCSEYFNDHDTKHFNANPTHCIHMNQSSQRIWCYVCETEVFLPSSNRGECASDMFINMSRHLTDRSGSGTLSSVYSLGGSGGSATTSDPFMADENVDSSAEDDFDSDNHLTSGLVGLQNIANTCYMNAALQALSNTPALTGYFLECGDIIEYNNDMVPTTSRKTGLARSYHRLVKDMWLSHRRTNGWCLDFVFAFFFYIFLSCSYNVYYMMIFHDDAGYLVPSGILNGIRNVHPMFRGYQQHDTQEFLRFVSNDISIMRRVAIIF